MNKNVKILNIACYNFRFFTLFKMKGNLENETDVCCQERNDFCQ